MYNDCMNTVQSFFDTCRMFPAPTSEEVKAAREGKKTVAMVGMASTSRSFAPFDNPDIPIWALNESATPKFDYLKRVDRIYQLHPDWDFLRPYNHNYEDYPKWIKEKHPFEIVMQEKYQFVPSAIRYPIEDIINKFGKRALYFTSSAPYLIAHALYEGYQRIEMYGFEMAADEEYANQKPCTEFWLGAAIGMGVDVYLPPGNALLGGEMRLYGYEMRVGILPMHVEIRKRAIIQQNGELQKQLSEFEGKKKALVEKVKAAPDNEKGELIKQITAIDNELSWVVGRINYCSGALGEIRNEENSLNGHLAKWEDSRSQKAALMIAKRETPAVVKPAVITPEMARWHVEESPAKPVTPKKKRHHR